MIIGTIEPGVPNPPHCAGTHIHKDLRPPEKRIVVATIMRSAPAGSGPLRGCAGGGVPQPIPSMDFTSIPL